MDVEGFYRDELAVRRELRFPPFSRLLRLVIRSSRRDHAETAADGIANVLRQRLAGITDVELLGPAPAPLERINRNWRYQIILRGASAGTLVRLVASVRGEINRLHGVYTELDVDPVQLL
jgi:primosomal protein N' (replication factor Y)